MIIIPIPINCEDLPDLDFEGFGRFLLCIFICSLGIIPLTYSILGVINGFDAWGLKSVSVFIGLLVSNMIVLVGSMFFD